MRHYTQKEKQAAIDVYIANGYSYSAVQKELGYPPSPTFYRWYNTFLRQGFIEGEPDYTPAKKQAAVDYYLENGKNATETVRQLGYPTRWLLCKWIDELAPGQRRCNASPQVPSRQERIASLIESLAALCEVSSDTVQAALYNGSNLWVPRKGQVVADQKDLEELLSQIESLKAQVFKLEGEVKQSQMEADLWRGAAELLKKDPGIELECLCNRHKALLIDALKTTYPLAQLLARLKMAKSSYYYQVKALAAPDKYANLRLLIREEFEAEGKARGHRTIWARLRRRQVPVVVSEKVVLRLMKEEGLFVPYSNRHSRHWSSYQGEISRRPKNLVERHFHAEAPNRLWLTDITQFTLPHFKCYLSAVIDCFDGKVVAAKISRRPSARLANSMLDAAIATLSAGEHPICHNDCGSHYRWPGWIERCDKAGIVRSMSKKGCSPDNAACEGFFGRLKNEFFYHRDWEEVTFQQFVGQLEAYLEFYNEGRIKKSLGWMSPNEYRRSLGLMA